MFEPLPGKFDFVAAERDVLRFWDEQRIFERSLEQRRAQGAARFVFYEGPPTANGLPHPGHALTRAIKDLFPRYQTMCGKLVERKAGWDTHGLPVEVEVCKELGIHTKEEIEAYGVEKFNLKCIQSVFRYTQQWEEMTRRLGFWVNLDEAYVTYHQSYVESVWWSLKTLFERGLLYQGHKVVWWWPQAGTALSAGEVGEGYRTVDDPSVFVRFPLLDEEPRASARAAANATPGSNLSDDPDDDFKRRGGPPARTSLLVWTTTPWTLLSNHFAAVNPNLEYALVHDTTTNERLYIASELVESIAKKVKHELEIVVHVKGSTLVGRRYLPPFASYYEYVHGEMEMYFGLGLVVELLFGKAPTTRLGDLQAALKGGGTDYIGWRVLAADFVTIDSGSGIVHEAPAFGEVDFDLLQKERQRFAEPTSIPLLCAVAPNGTFTPDAGNKYAGRFIKDSDKDIIRELKERGLLYHQETVKHEYPFAPRAENDPLIQYARRSWFVRTSQFRDEFLKNNAQVNWLPEHIKEGRFGDFLRNNVDWALSRERFWGTPLPVWVCEQTGRMEALGSLAELQAKPAATDATPEYPQGYWDGKVEEHRRSDNLELPDHLRVHKPYIDAWTYDSPFVEGTENRERGTGKARMRRVPEVIDCWWDAGSMPFAQWGFPHAAGSPEKLAERFPADFISEAIDQTRGWFYGLLSINTLLFAGGAGILPALPASEGGAGIRPALQSAKTRAGPDPPPPSRGVGPRLETKSRRLPHWQAGSSTCFVTFRTSGAMRDDAGKVWSSVLNEHERDIALDACRYFHRQRVDVHAVVVMPDHVHLLITPHERSANVWWSLSELLHSIKSHSGREIAALRRAAIPSWTGHVWQDEYFDRIIRSDSDFQEKLQYILNNPATRGLPEDYRWIAVPDWDTPSFLPNGTDMALPTGRQDACPTRYPLPFRTCIVLGHMMGEDGLKMSKRKKNYKEPSYIFDSLGADAMRWYFFSAQAPWTTTRFVEASIRDAHRDFLVKLYNVLSFFNIYANIDGFEVKGIGNPGAPEPDGGERGAGKSEHAAQASVPQSEHEAQPSEVLRATGWRAPGARGELDRWVLSELHRTIAFVREKMDAFENYPAAVRLNDFVDALSNWYLRRSRERFWRPVHISPAGAGSRFSPHGSPGAPGSPSLSNTNQEKWDAYNTLHEVLSTLSKLIAPFTPFFAEVLHRKLKGSSAAPAHPASVHLCDYPHPDASLLDQALAAEMDLVRDIVSAGRAARTEAKLKVRQPLARVEIVLGNHEHEGWLQSHAGLIAEELNVKAVEFATSADQYVSYHIKPNFKALGPRFGKLAPQIAAALQKIDAAAARQTLTETGQLPLEVGGQPPGAPSVTLTPAEVEIRLEARPGWSAAQSRAGVLVLSTELTPELKDEGLIRELIHHVQTMRKEQNLPYQQRVTLHVVVQPTRAADQSRALDQSRARQEADSSSGLEATVKKFAPLVQSECLALSIEFAAPQRSASPTSVELEGQAVDLYVIPQA